MIRFNFKLISTLIKVCVLCSTLLSVAVHAERGPMIKGFNITEDGDFDLVVSETPDKLSEAQKAVMEAKRLGSNHIVINPRAIMLSPFANELLPVKKEGENNRQMTGRLVKFLKWIKTQGLSTQIRPIFFVVKDKVSFAPYIVEENGVKKIYWHGNIQPENPNAWFDSFKAYHDMYLLVGKLANIDYYTIGAELYTMTVGIEDVWEKHPHGFPKLWVQLLDYAKSKLPLTTKIMYDVNFTDDRANNDGLSASGGEFERWRYRLVDLAVTGERTEANQSWFDLKEFWLKLDAIGIDMYRSFAAKSDTIPTKYDDLVKFLRQRSDRYANQLDTAMLEIDSTLESSKPVIFKEIGFRSTTNAFIDPFAYDKPTDTVNIDHQAASYQAFCESFFDAGMDWFAGVAFWDIGVNPNRRGVTDAGFTPLGKEKTERIIKHYFNKY